MNYRIGFGYDVHRLVEGRELWLGGIRIDHTVGLLGHSDADVLIHAICDALLGAANMRDIGFHFPDTANETLNINPHIPAMQQCMAQLMGVDPDAVSIKATTSERMGFVGRQEGMAAYATALIEKV